MADNVMKFKISEVVKGVIINVKITGMAIWKCRLWLGVQIFKLAAKTIGCGIKVDMEEPPEPVYEETGLLRCLLERGIPLGQQELEDGG